MRLTLILTTVCLLSACASYPVNQPQTTYDENAGYRFEKLSPDRTPTSDNSDSLFVCLSFSGGGTRAAAFAYGVLQKLRDTTIVWEGKKKTLLDEVDCISGISGGSFTAAYYGLFGKHIFDEYKEKFLYRNIEGELIAKVLLPWNWPRLMSPTFNRIDLATELYDETIFNQKTFADLSAQNRRPFIILNATDLASGERFEFTQERFDLLGSDLGQVPVARAVAASSAFPFLLSPITLKNYPQPAGFTVPVEMQKGKQDYDSNRRHWHWVSRGGEYLDKQNKPYVHLMDGGLSDNIGLKAIENVFRRSGGFIRERINTNMKKFVVIVANARTENQDRISKSDIPPELAEVGYKTATIALDNYSFESIEAMRDLVKQRQQMQQAVSLCNDKLMQCPKVKPFPPLSNEVDSTFIDLNFETYPDQQIRAELLNMPTSFELSQTDVDKLIRVGGDLLDNSKAFSQLRQELQTDRPAL
jgi:predicted acylesterase/phospholipase RssA